LLAGVFAAIVAARLSAAQPLVITTGIIGGVAMLILLLRIASRIILPIVHEEPRFPALDQEQTGE
jgi:hypothetical protein